MQLEIFLHFQYLSLTSSPFLCSPLKVGGLIFLISPCKISSFGLLLYLLIEDTLGLLPGHEFA
jgi:hypothetical protein